MEFQCLDQFLSKKTEKQINRKTERATWRAVIGWYLFGMDRCRGPLDRLSTAKKKIPVQNKKKNSRRRARVPARGMADGGDGVATAVPANLEG